MQVIGIMGRKQHGKDTIANFLINEQNFAMYDDFATSIRKALCEIFGWEMSSFDTNESKEEIDPIYGISRRQGMQSLGDDYGKKMLCEMYPKFKETTGDSLWVKRWVQKLDKIYQQMKNNIDYLKIVIPGIRFPSEVSLIHRLNGEVWKVVDPRKEITDNHSSEMHVDNLPFDEYILNNSDLNGLKTSTFISYDRFLVRTKIRQSINTIPDSLLDLVY